MCIFHVVVVGDPAAVLSNVRLVIEAAKSAKNIWDYVKDFPPTFAEHLVSIVSRSENEQGGEKDKSPSIHSSYDFVVDLTRPTDIFRILNAYPVTFPLGKDVYDDKVKEDGIQISRFVVNVVGRYNVGKTYILRMLANINLGHAFTERTNGLSVALPLLSQTQDTPIALIDTAGTRTPVEYDDEIFKDKSYERQVSDSFIQEIALNSAEIFVLVVNQLTLDDQLYLKTLYKRLQVNNGNTRYI
jgi:predicted GTPase